MPELYCRRVHGCVSSSPPFQHLAPEIAGALFSRIHKVCSRNTAWELEEGVFRLKLCAFFRGLISARGTVHTFRCWPGTAALCTADDSARARGGNGDSIPIAV